MTNNDKLEAELRKALEANDPEGQAEATKKLEDAQKALDEKDNS